MEAAVLRRRRQAPPGSLGGFHTVPTRRLTAASPGCTNGSRASRPPPAPARPAPNRKDPSSVTFPELEQTAPSAPSLSRIKRTLTEQAIAKAPPPPLGRGRRDQPQAASSWARTPRPRTASRRPAGRWASLAQAREHYQSALALDPTNRIAERNIDRLRMLLAEAGKKTVPAQQGSKAPVSIFVEETGKTGFAHLIDLADPEQLAQVNPGDCGRAGARGPASIANSNGDPHRLRRAARRGPPAEAHRRRQQVRRRRDLARRHRTSASSSARPTRTRPTTARSRSRRRPSLTDLRPYTKGTLIREEMDLEEELEHDEEDEEIEDIGRVLPAEVTSDEAFVEEPDELDEPWHAAPGTAGATTSTSRARRLSPPGAPSGRLRPLPDAGGRAAVGSRPRDPAAAAVRPPPAAPRPLWQNRRPWSRDIAGHRPSRSPCRSSPGSAPRAPAGAAGRPDRGPSRSRTTSSSTSSGAAAGSPGRRSPWDAGRFRSRASPLTRLLADVVVRAPDLRHTWTRPSAWPPRRSAPRACGLDRRALRDALARRAAGRWPSKELVWEPRARRACCAFRRAARSAVRPA